MPDLIKNHKKAFWINVDIIVKIMGQKIMNAVFLNVKQPTKVLAGNCLRVLRLPVKPASENGERNQNG